MRRVPHTSQLYRDVWVMREAHPVGLCFKKENMQTIELGVAAADGEETPAPPPTESRIQQAERLLKIRSKSGTLVPLTANTAQWHYEQQRGEKNIILKARQMGMSTWIAGQFFLKTIQTPGTMTVLVAHTREATEQMFRIVQRMWENLPDEWREGKAKRSRANVGQMVFPALDSEFRVVSAGEQNAGRSMSIQNLHCSELSRWPGDAAATLAGLKAAVAPGGEMVLESTPNGAYGCFYQEWMEAEAQGMVRHFLPWWMEPTYLGPSVEANEWTEEERALVAREGLRPQQIGYRRELQRTYRGMARQEFAEDAVSCFRASGECFFELDAVEARLTELTPPLTSRRGGSLLTWMPAVQGRRYLVAADPAGGGNEGDFAAVQVLDVDLGIQCAELRQRLNPRELAEVVIDLAREYNQALIVVERNNHGAGVLAYLEKRGVAVYEEEGQAGWLTHSVTRPRMLAKLSVLLNEQPWLFKSERLLTECRSFVRGLGGRPEAAAGAHDDCVMSMAMALAVREEVAGQQVSKSASQ